MKAKYNTFKNRFIAAWEKMVKSYDENLSGIDYSYSEFWNTRDPWMFF